MATSTYGTPYVQGSDLVSAYPTASSNLATRIDEVSYQRNGLNAQTGTTYTLVVGDAGKTITLSNASAVTVTLPQDSVATLPTGAVVSFYNLGAGTATISQGTGATLQGGSITLAQYAVTSVIKLSANTYGKFDAESPSGLSLVSPSSIANSGGTASASGGQVTFTAVTSISVNGCFTTTYDNYRILLSYNGSVAEYLNMRLRGSGTDLTTTTYAYQFLQASSSTVSGSNFTSQNRWPEIVYYASSQTSVSIDIFDPALSKATFLNVFESRAVPTVRVGAGNNSTASAYDGFTIYPTTGTITGTVRIYGYKNS